jgi:hypothetical protein
MASANPSNPFFASLERVISVPRLDSYRRNGEDPKLTLCKYLWNVKLCESLYVPMQFLEVAFRNAAHWEIAKRCGTPDWLSNRHQFLHVDERRQIDEAEGALRAHGKTPTEPYLVSELRFGFWTSLLDARYDQLWPRIIAGVFPHMPRTIRTRREVSRLANRVRKLRNAALHHHSIWHWHDLREQHENIYTLLDYICASTARLARTTDRFKTVHSGSFTQFSTLVDSFM